MQVTACDAKIYFYHKKDSSWHGQYVGVLFVIPVIITIQNHRFEIFTLVLEIHENVDLVLGNKNLFELEGVIDSWNSCFSFLNRSIPLFPKEKVEVKPKE